MTYIKKLVMKGFKSFARETTINLDKHMNCVVGPNGSGKSNVTDAMCFVLGRLSIKSIRAAKASHLIFSGNKQYKAANIAYVEITFDNSEKTFSLEEPEVVIKRMVKKNGQSVYKINNETKTRQEVLELLSQAGIDPHGFNIVLQGEIEKFVKMPAEERRKIIEEVAGISVYEMRKSKSLRELEKTEEKLKQINTVLRERTSYLKNLENEREQALRFQKLQLTVKRCKASVINKNIQEKNKELNNVLEKVNSKNKEIGKKEDLIKKTQQEVNITNKDIETISKTVQKSSGFEQDSLLSEISNLKQGLAGMSARKENFENQLLELERRRKSLEESIKSAEKEIEEMTKEKGKNKKKELQEKKSKLEELDELKRKYYLLKSNLSSFNSQIGDKKRQIQRLKNESNFILEQIENTEKEIKIEDSLESHNNILIKLKHSIEDTKIHLLKLEEEIIQKEKNSAIQEQLIRESEKIKSQVSKLDICPLCKTKMTAEHIKEVVNKSDSNITKAKNTIKELEGKIKGDKEKLEKLKQENSKKISEINIREIDIIKISTIQDKKQNLKRNQKQIKDLEIETNELESKKKSLENKLSSVKLSEEQYDALRLEIDELQRTEERNLGTEITAKQRELERTKIAINQNKRDKEDILDDLKDIEEDLNEKHELVEEKEEQALILRKKYQKMFERKNLLQDKVRTFEYSVIKHQNEKRIFEQEINNMMIEKAQINAKKENFLEELKEFEGVELISLSLEKLREKLSNTEDILSRIGNVNLRALEVYGGVKTEYDKIKEKVEQLEKEKQEILKIIEQIDRKKRKTFLHTLSQMNELFSRNFSQLSVKGTVSLEPQDKKEIFNAGLNILVKVGPGKYFDVTSLSGGEQCLVALSLIFAIQEHRPYHFYIFDEIDAALDRRNSEKLAYLLKKHMKKGQYLIITHNDSIISESSNILYGVSMQDGISKVLSIEV